MSIFDSIKRFLKFDGGFAQHPPDADYWYEPRPMSPVDALQVSTVVACIRVLAESVATLPCQVFRRLPNGGKELAPDHPAFSVVHDMANDYFTACEFFDWMVTQIYTKGQALARIRLSGRDDVSAIEPIDWSLVTVHRDRTTNIRVFRVRRTDGGEDMLVDSEVLYIPSGFYDGTKAKSYLEMGAASIGLSAIAQRYVTQYFGKNAIGPVYASFPEALGEKGLETWAKWFREKFTGAENGGSIPVFDRGGDLKALGINHVDMQLAELRRFQVEEICRFFRIPPHLVQDLSRSTNNNIEHQSLDFVMHCLRPLCERIEQRLNVTLFGPRERSLFFVEFNLSALMRGDSAGRAAYYQAMRNSGLMTANEIRGFENLNPIEGGDKLLIQGAMIPVDQAGQQQQAQVAK